MFIGHFAVGFASKRLAPKALAVVSHWVLDVATHLPDMPLSPWGGTLLGLGIVALGCRHGSGGRLHVRAGCLALHAGDEATRCYRLLWVVGTSPADRRGLPRQPQRVDTPERHRAGMDSCDRQPRHRGLGVVGGPTSDCRAYIARWD